LSPAYESKLTTVVSFNAILLILKDDESFPNEKATFNSLAKNRRKTALKIRDGAIFLSGTVCLKIKGNFESFFYIKIVS